MSTTIAVLINTASILRKKFYEHMLQSNHHVKAMYKIFTYYKWAQPNSDQSSLKIYYHHSQRVKKVTVIIWSQKPNENLKHNIPGAIFYVTIGGKICLNVSSRL